MVFLGTPTVREALPKRHQFWLEYRWPEWKRTWLRQWKETRGQYVFRLVDELLARLYHANLYTGREIDRRTGEFRDPDELGFGEWLVWRLERGLAGWSERMRALLYLAKERGRDSANIGLPLPEWFEEAMYKELPRWVHRWTGLRDGNDLYDAIATHANVRRFYVVKCAVALLLNRHLPKHRLDEDWHHFIDLAAWDVSNGYWDSDPSGTTVEVYPGILGWYHTIGSL